MNDEVKLVAPAVAVAAPTICTATKTMLHIRPIKALLSVTKSHVVHWRFKVSRPGCCKSLFGPMFVFNHGIMKVSWLMWLSLHHHFSLYRLSCAFGYFIVGVFCFDRFTNKALVHMRTDIKITDIIRETMQVFGDIGGIVKRKDTFNIWWDSSRF